MNYNDTKNLLSIYNYIKEAQKPNNVKNAPTKTKEEWGNYIRDPQDIIGGIQQQLQALGIPPEQTQGIIQQISTIHQQVASAQQQQQASAQGNPNAQQQQQASAQGDPNTQ